MNLWEAMWKIYRRMNLNWLVKNRCNVFFDKWNEACSFKRTFNARFGRLAPEDIFLILRLSTYPFRSDFLRKQMSKLRKA